MRRRRPWLVLAVLGAAASALPAQQPPGMLGYRDSDFQRGQKAGETPAPLAGVGVDPKIGGSVPLDVELVDVEGRRRALGDLVRDKPVVLVPAYYTCPMLCSMVTGGVVKALRVVDFEPGRDYEVVVFSFDPADGPAEARRKREETRRYLGTDDVPGWHFLTGDEASIRGLTNAIGFRYRWDAEQRQFAHTAAIALLTPSGRISRYFFGLEYAPRDLRLGLVESAEEKLGSVVDQVLLYCFQYDPATGKYSAAVLNLVRAGGVLTLAALGLFMFVTWRRGHAAAHPGEST
ncbi:MAG: SCO family protein [Thermoanaerobaculia bacterium]